jgi:hypothetical protein
MDAAFWLSILSIGVTAALGVLVFVNNRRANRTAEKKLTVEEQAIADEREDVIARRRKEELDRLYARYEAMEEDIASLKESRKGDQAKIRVLEARAELADAREVLLYRHTKELRAHILNQLPPPPPTMPLDLVQWFEQFEMTNGDG